MALAAACSVALAPARPVWADKDLEIPNLPIPFGKDGGLPIPIPGGDSGGGLPIPIPTSRDVGGLPIPIGNDGSGLPVNVPRLALPRFGAPVKMFGEVIPGVLYRSAQPSAKGFAWLRDQGIKSIVDLRAEHDDGEDAVEAAGFEHYLYLPIVDLHPPSDDQAETFLDFVRDRDHWPTLMHCNLGIMRAGTMAVLARYSLEGTSLEDALAESLPFGGGPVLALDWLNGWSSRHAPGEFGLDR